MNAVKRMDKTAGTVIRKKLWRPLMEISRSKPQETVMPVSTLRSYPSGLRTCERLRYWRQSPFHVIKRNEPARHFHNESRTSRDSRSPMRRFLILRTVYWNNSRNGRTILWKNVNRLSLQTVCYTFRKEYEIKKYAVYTILGYDIDGKKGILGLWLNETESKHSWMQIFDEIKARGVFMHGWSQWPGERGKSDLQKRGGTEVYGPSDPEFGEVRTKQKQ